MNKSTRVSVIMSLMTKLREQGVDSDLVLGEHGFDVIDDWNYHGDPIRDTLRAGSDAQLLELCDHFGLAIEEEARQSILPKCWDGEDCRIFVSHSSKQKLFAKELSFELGLSGIKAFVAHEDITPSERWKAEIVRALNSCDACVAICSKDFKASDWTDQELGWCLARNRSIIPVHYDLNPYGFVGAIQAVRRYSQSGHEKSAEMLSDKLVTLLLGNPETLSRARGAIIRGLSKASSYKQAIRCAKRVNAFESLTHSECATIWASRFSTDIVGAWGVPEKIDRWMKENNFQTAPSTSDIDEIPF